MKVYKNIFALTEHFENTTPNHPFLKSDPEGFTWVNSLPEDLEWVNCGRNYPAGQLCPSIFSPYLYRGQTEVYSPCYPKVYRNFPFAHRPKELPEKYRTKFLASQIKALWFVSLLQRHPAVNYARKSGILINPLAIAQHYGLSTHYLDLTGSITVAAFFACCEYKDKVWQSKATGQGVIYRFRPAASLESLKSTELIGLVTFPRPGEQKAWAVPLRLGVDFENMPHVEKFLFNHTLEGSAHYLNMHNSGKSLLLDDPATDVANSIVNSKIVPLPFVTQALSRFGCVPFKLKQTLKIFKNRLIEYCNLEVKSNVSIAFTKAQIRKISIYLSKRKGDFRGKIIPVRYPNHEPQSQQMQK